MPNGVSPTQTQSEKQGMYAQDGQSSDKGGMGRPSYYQMPQMSTLPPTANPSKWNRNYDNLSTRDRQEMLVDEIFALYLYRMANRIN
jgi:hypothetical protein